VPSVEGGRAGWPGAAAASARHRNDD